MQYEYVLYSVMQCLHCYTVQVHFTRMTEAPNDFIIFFVWLNNIVCWVWKTWIFIEIWRVYLHRFVGFFDEFDGLGWDLRYFGLDHRLVAPIIFAALNSFVVHSNRYFALDVPVVYWLVLSVHTDIGFGAAAAGADAGDLVSVKSIVFPLQFQLQFQLHFPFHLLLPIFVNVQYPADDRPSHWWHHKRTKRSDWSLIDTYFGSRIRNGRFDTDISYFVWHFRLIHNLIEPINALTFGLEHGARHVIWKKREQDAAGKKLSHANLLHTNVRLSRSFSSNCHACIQQRHAGTHSRSQIKLSQLLHPRDCFDLHYNWN